MKTIFINHYSCEDCGIDWEDAWSCACNDRCPDCDSEIEPYEVEEKEVEDSEYDYIINHNQ